MIPTGQPTPIRRSLESLLRHLGGPTVSVASQLGARWPDIVGPGLAATTRPIELVDRVLVIGCDDAAWASQIGWMEHQITRRLVATFPDIELDRIATRTA